jgi:hypothetical protein
VDLRVRRRVLASLVLITGGVHETWYKVIGQGWVETERFYVFDLYVIEARMAQR